VRGHAHLTHNRVTFKSRQYVFVIGNEVFDVLVQVTAQRARGMQQQAGSQGIGECGGVRQLLG